MTGKTVLILGAGTGGLVAANRLRRMLGREHRVILVDRSPIYYFAPSFTWVMTGQRTPSRIARDLRKLAKKGIEFITGDIRAIDTARKRVLVNEQTIAYDYLVIALGVDYSADEIPGLHRAWTFYHVDGAEALADELPKLRSGRIAIVVGALPYKCPPAPYEGALLIDDYFRKRKLRDQIDIHVYTPEAVPLTAAGQGAGEMVLGLLARQGIGFTGGASVKSVNQEKRTLNFTDAAHEDFDLLIATPVHKVPAMLIESEVSRGSWLSVDRETLATEFEDVYAIGDVNEIPIAEGMMLPKAGVFAHGEAEVVSRNIAAEINEGQPIWAFGGQGACFMETGRGRGCYISGNYFTEPKPAVAVRGEGRFSHWSKAGFERVWLWRWF